MRPIGMVGEGDVSGAASSSGTTVTLRDVRILVTPLTLQQHLDFFAPGPHNTTDVANATFVYTDRVSFVHVNSWFNGHTTWLSVGLLVADSLEDALATSAVPMVAGSGADPLQGAGDRPARTYMLASGRGTGPLQREAARQLQRNYVLAADNGTIVSQLIVRCGVPTPVPLLVYLTANVTMSKPPVPQASIDIRRPVGLMGAAAAKTSIDFGMRVNQWNIAPGVRYQDGFLTLDSLVLENLAYGDARSAEVAMPESVASPLNFWPVYSSRLKVHFAMNNVTLVVATQEELDCYAYRVTAHNTHLHQRQESTVSVAPGASTLEWRLTGNDPPGRLSVARSHAECGRDHHYLLTVQQQVAPKLVLPPLDPSLIQPGASEECPPVVRVETGSNLKAALRTRPAAPAGGTRPPRVLLLRLPAEPLGPALVTPGPALVPVPLQVLGEAPTQSSPLVVLDLSYQVGALALPRDAPKGSLILTRVSLRGLAQGPGAEEAAAAAGGPRVPELWTLLLWGVERHSPLALFVEDSRIALPPPELSYLAAMADASSDFSVPLKSEWRDDKAATAGQAGGGSRRLMGAQTDLPPSTGGVTAMDFRGVEADGAGGLRVTSFVAGTLHGRNVTLVPDSDRAQTVRGGAATHFWPSGALGMPPQGASGTPLPAWVPGVIAALSAAALLAMAAAAAVLVARELRGRRRAGAMGEPRPEGPGKRPAQAAPLPGDGRQGGGMTPPGHAPLKESRDRRGRPGRTAAAASAPPALAAAAADTTSAPNAAERPGPAPAPPPSSPVRICAASTRARGRRAAGAAAAAEQPSQHSLVRVQRGIREMQERIVDMRKQAAAHPATPSPHQSALGGLLCGRGSSYGSWAAASSNGGGSASTSFSHAGPCSDVGSVGPPSALQLQLLEVVGQGAFATVYKAVWRGRFVAVKVLPFMPQAGPAASAPRWGGATNPLENLAIMEAAVSSTLSHPNIVQVYHLFMAPLPVAGAAAGASLLSLEGLVPPEPPAVAGPDSSGGGAGSQGRQLCLVMEYCEEGSLRSALDCGLLSDSPGERPEPPVREPGLTRLEHALSLAHDIAVATLHLHSESIIHGDLKASNVLLARCSGAAAAAPVAAPSLEQAASLRHRFTAKVADFGLSLYLGPDATHITQTHAGTMTHMAPELLLDGRASKASDVYAYGIVLWELLTGRRAFSGLPVPLLCIKVTQERCRPSWPQGVSIPLRVLAEACWSHEADARPSFQDIVLWLEALMLQPSLLDTSGSRSEAAAAAAAATTSPAAAEPPAAAAAAAATATATSPDAKVAAPAAAGAGAAAPAGGQAPAPPAACPLAACRQASEPGNSSSSGAFLAQSALQPPPPPLTLEVAFAELALAPGDPAQGGDLGASPWAAYDFRYQ